MAFGMPMYTGGFQNGDNLAGVAVAYVILSDIERYLVETIGEGHDGMFAYIVNEATGSLVATSVANVAVIGDGAGGVLNTCTGTEASCIGMALTSDQDIQAIEAFTHQSEDGPNSGVIHVMDLPTRQLSWVQSKSIEMESEITGATNATINWHLVVVQQIDCPKG